MSDYSDQYSIRKYGTNSEYSEKYQNLPFVSFPCEPGVVMRVGTAKINGICPRCASYIVPASRVVRLYRKEMNRWFCHADCWDAGLKQEEVVDMMIKRWLATKPEKKEVQK